MTHPPAGPSTPTPPPGPKVPGFGNGHALPPIPDPRSGHARNGAGAGPIALAQLVSDLRLLTAKAYAMSRSQWDPTSGPGQCDPYTESESDVDIRMSAIGADLRSALSGLDGLRALTSFPVGAVAPGAGGRPAEMGVAIPAGTSSPALTPGKEPSPGSATAISSAARESDGVGAVVAGTSSGPRLRHTHPEPSVGVGVRPGAGPSCARTSGSCPGDERGVTCHASCGEFTAGAAPMAAGFVLPKPKPWQWPGTTRLARATYNATRATGPAWPTG